MKPYLKFAFYTSGLIAVLSPFSALALTELSDNQLSSTAAQDGISISIDLNGGLGREAGTIGIDTLNLIDADGFSPNALETDGAGAASFKFGTGGIRLCAGSTASANCGTVNEAAVIDIDTAGGVAGATAQISISTSAGSYFIPVESVSLLGLQTLSPGVLSKTSSGRNITTGQVKMLEFGNKGIAVNLAQALKANIQLGNQIQGALLVIDPNVVSVDFGRLTFLSYNDSGAGTTAAESSFGFDLSLSNVNFTDGIKVDVDGQAGIVANFGDVSISEASLANVSFGDTSPTSTTNISSVDGLRNASIGSFSLSNATFNDLRVGITGL